MADDEATSSFFEAIAQGNEREVERMLEAEPSLAEAQTAEGISATLYALYHRRLEVAERIADARPAEKQLSIFEAAALGRVTDVRAALDADPAQVDAIAPDGFTPLGLAAFFDRAEVALLLLERGADPGEASHNGMHVAPLHSAVAAGSVPIATALLEKGADVNAVQMGDYTPLHEAAHTGQAEMIELLLRHGADRDARQSAGETPFQTARAAGHTEVLTLLEPVK